MNTTSTTRTATLKRGDVATFVTPYGNQTVRVVGAQRLGSARWLVIEFADGDRIVTHPSHLAAA
ncbi:hypothetical protein GCM10022215_17830 [Nocardioides fonticola]|uniref:DUF1918 domain-containing protein n=1 Tax=Nocardioides fonticola TaxID=450363 RepID=A0ABP7XIP8_9ACTN